MRRNAAWEVGKERGARAVARRGLAAFFFKQRLRVGCVDADAGLANAPVEWPACGFSEHTLPITPAGGPCSRQS
jgi:hypothetical protein